MLQRTWGGHDDPVWGPSEGSEPLTKHRHAVQNLLWERGHLRDRLLCSPQDALEFSTDGSQSLGVLEEEEQEPEGSRTHVPLQREEASVVLTRGQTRGVSSLVHATDTAPASAQGSGGLGFRPCHTSRDNPGPSLASRHGQDLLHSYSIAERLLRGHSWHP